jgi:glucose-6-phosphate 1-epimerase
MVPSVRTVLLEGAPALQWDGPDGSCATVLLRGGQLLSWRAADGQELLYRSPASALNRGSPVRGGVPVVFPQFGPDGPLPRHGFARQRLWQRRAASAQDAAHSVRLTLDVAVGEEPLWPHACRCTLHLALQPNQLEMHLEVENTGPTALRFAAALHSYWAVAHTGAARLRGVLPGSKVMPVAGPVDRVLTPSGPTLWLDTGAYQLTLQHRGFDQLVVWNPGPESQLPDLPAQGHYQFVCIEPAVIDHPVQLEKGGIWRGDMLITYNRPLFLSHPGPRNHHGQPTLDNNQ